MRQKKSRHHIFSPLKSDVNSLETVHVHVRVHVCMSHDTHERTSTGIDHWSSTRGLCKMTKTLPTVVSRLKFPDREHESIVFLLFLLYTRKNLPVHAAHALPLGTSETDILLKTGFQTYIFCSKVPSKCRKFHFRDPNFKKFQILLDIDITEDHVLGFNLYLKVTTYVFKNITCVIYVKYPPTGTTRTTLYNTKHVSSLN